MTAVAAPHRSSDRTRFGRLPEALATTETATDDAILVAYVEAGTGSYREGPECCEMGPGDALVTAPGAHRDLSGLAPARGWLLALDPQVAGMHAGRGGRLVPDPGHPAWLSFVRPACLVGRLPLPRELAAEWDTLGRRLEAEASSRAFGYNQALAGLATLVLLDVARLTVPGLGGASLRGEPLAAQAFDVIERRFDAPISLDDVAAEVAVSPSHLTRVMRRLTGRTVNEWIAERRMAEARRLLLETDAKVETVARRSGYTDAGYFRRHFRRHHGVAPAHWRAAATAG